MLRRENCNQTGDGSEAKRSHWSAKGPELGSSHLHGKAHILLELQLQDPIPFFGLFWASTLTNVGKPSLWPGIGCLDVSEVPSAEVVETSLSLWSCTELSLLLLYTRGI